MTGQWYSGNQTTSGHFALRLPRARPPQVHWASAGLIATGKRHSEHRQKFGYPISSFWRRLLNGGILHSLFACWAALVEMVCKYSLLLHRTSDLPQESKHPAQRQVREAWSIVCITLGGTRASSNVFMCSREPYFDYVGISLESMHVELDAAFIKC